ncbi:MAG: hypothetical protein M1426_00645 [Patescibacteria group bacterium]|nr:hypothetical protein [Patescibacteria group bacterium]
MKADITHKNILIPEYEEATSLGAAVLATVQCGFYSSVDEAANKFLKIRKTYIPSDKSYYDERYKTFLNVYDQLTPVFNREN